MPTPQAANDAIDPDTARTERHMLMLAELGEIGMDLAREVRRQALDSSKDAPPAADLALTFSRIARAVRQTVALEAKLAEGPQAGRAERAPLTVSDRWRSARRKRQVGEIVGDIIDSEAASEFDADDLTADLRERLDDGDEEETDFADRPLGELVARICRDLGVEPDWSQFEDEDWAIAAKASSPPGEAERGEGRERGDAGVASTSPGPAMTHPPPPLAPPWPTSGH